MHVLRMCRVMPKDKRTVREQGDKHTLTTTLQRGASGTGNLGWQTLDFIILYRSRSTGTH